MLLYNLWCAVLLFSGGCSGHESEFHAANRPLEADPRKKGRNEEKEFEILEIRVPSGSSKGLLIIEPGRRKKYVLMR